jgi:hypothetical protein
MWLKPIRERFVVWMAADAGPASADKRDGQEDDEGQRQAWAQR